MEIRVNTLWTLELCIAFYYEGRLPSLNFIFIWVLDVLALQPRSIFFCGALSKLPLLSWAEPCKHATTECFLRAVFLASFLGCHGGLPWVS